MNCIPGFSSHYKPNGRGHLFRANIEHLHLLCRTDRGDERERMDRQTVHPDTTQHKHTKFATSIVSITRYSYANTIRLLLNNI